MKQENPYQKSRGGFSGNSARNAVLIAALRANR
jgi:hypothetical protein